MSELYAEETITLSGANPQTDVNMTFITTGTNTGKFIRVYLTKDSDTGTAYTADSLGLEMFQRQNIDATHPRSRDKHSFYRRIGVEPDPIGIGGDAIDDSDLINPVGISNQTSGQNGVISARLTRTGGDATSEEVYTIQVYGEGD